MQRWVKWPGPGEFRGEGEWMTIQKVGMPVETFDYYREISYVPTYVGDEMPDDDVDWMVQVKDGMN